MSIIDPKYRTKYRGEKDFLSTLIDTTCLEKVTREVTKKQEDGTSVTEVVPTKETRVNLDRLFALAAANNIDAKGKYGEQADRKNAPGRLRMTIGNMLRAAAKHRHGLFTIDELGKPGDFIEAPAEFLNGAEKTQNPDGSKIAKAKPVEAAPATEGQDAPVGEEA